MTQHTDFARPVDRTLYEAPGRPAAPPLGHPAAVPAGAPVSVTPRKPEDVRLDDNARVLARIQAKALDNPVDRALHRDPVDTTVTPPSLALHARQVAVHQPDAPLPGAAPAIDRTLYPSFPVSPTVSVPAPAPLPGTVPATVYDPWRPVQYLPTPQSGIAPYRPPVASEGHGTLDADLTAAQFAAVATSRAKFDRARSYAGRLGAHAAEIRAKLSAASERQVAAAIGKAEPDAAELGPLRGELVTVDRQHGQALAILAEVEAEHARHEADLAALIGSDGSARAKLVEAHSARALAQTAVDDAKALLDRAKAHAGATTRKLDAARSEEARHDADATARLRAALADGDAPPAAAEPFTRTSPALEDDLRAATAAVDSLGAEHAGKVAALASAERVVKGAVDGVLCSEAEAIARELNAADARALALRVRLHCYAKRRAADWVAPPVAPPKIMPGGWLAADPAAYALPPEVRQTAVIGQAITSAPLPASTGGYEGNWTVESAGWERYAAALASDPQAEAGFADGPAVPPSAPLPAPRAA